MTNQTFKKLPGVLSLTRRINVTDALFYNLLPDGSSSPIQVKRGGLRGTQNINKGSSADQVEVNNIQVTDFAKTAPDAVAVLVRMGVSFQPLKSGLNSCALSKGDDKDLLVNFRDSYFSFINRAGSNGTCSKGLQEVANRIARNIASGNWLWRNRQFAQAVEITATSGNEKLVFDALKVPARTFGNYSESEVALGNIIASQLMGESVGAIQVQARITFGEGMSHSVEVFPSQNYLGGDKPKGFARSLYAVGESDLVGKHDIMELESTRLVGQAALRDTKVANALRSFDTWYDDYDTNRMAIAIEPTGANLDAQRAFRIGDTSSFAYARKLNVIDVDSPEGMFMIAALIRGGVYSEGGDK